MPLFSIQIKIMNTILIITIIIVLVLYFAVAMAYAIKIDNALYYEYPKQHHQKSHRQGFDPLSGSFQLLLRGQNPALDDFFRGNRIPAPGKQYHGARFYRVFLHFQQTFLAEYLLCRSFPPTFQAVHGHTSHLIDNLYCTTVFPFRKEKFLSVQRVERGLLRCLQIIYIISIDSQMTI